MALLIGDNIYGVFEKYNISKREILDTYHFPDKVQALECNVTLYLKIQNIDEKRNIKLLATQVIEGVDQFVFVFYIPQKYFREENTLIEILSLFANEFGLKIKIGLEEGYFLKRTSRLTYGKVVDPNDIIDVLGPRQIPCDCFFFRNENLLGTLNTVTIFYAFAINTSKYLFWINSIPFVRLEIKAGWYDFVKNMVDYVEPHGGTRITMLKQKSTENLSVDKNNKYVFIDVPVNYKDKFKYITESINALKNNERILFKLSFSSPRCLFCYSHETSREHIFPKWLSPFLPETVLEGTQFTKIGDESLGEMYEGSLTAGKKESSKGYTTNLVCETCNNTWMSHLENEVKKILISDHRLIDSIPQNISRQESEILSRWLILKSLLLANKLFSNIHELPYEIFTEIKNGVLNNNFLVEVIKAENFELDFTINKGILFDKLFILKSIPLQKGKDLAKNYFSCCTHLGHLLFRISYLNSNIPLVRETGIIETFKLFPFNKEVRHRRTQVDQSTWQKANEANIEIHIFSNALFLVE